MRFLNIGGIGLLSLIALSALAQAPPLVDPATGARPGHEPGVGISLPLSNKASNITPQDTHSRIAPTLPDGNASDNAGARELLRAARTALSNGRTGQAQQSLEMAETQALHRPVPQTQTNVPSDSPLVTVIRDARLALGNGDSRQALQLIDQALTR
jgi:hypothetical protein